jgi:hypothetical protein
MLLIPKIGPNCKGVIVNSPEQINQGGGETGKAEEGLGEFVIT